MFIIVLSTIILNLVHSSQSAKILAVFPTPAISHQMAFRPITQELAKRGHEVIVVTPNPAFPKGDTPTNLTEIDAQYSYQIWIDFLRSSTGSKNEWFPQIRLLYEAYSRTFEMQLKKSEFQDLIKNKKNYFDLILVETVVRPTIALSHVFNAPVVQISSLSSIYNSLTTMGASIHPLLYPLSVAQRSYNHTFWEKTKEYLKFVIFVYIQHTQEVREDKMLKGIFGQDFPSLNELKKNVQMSLVNVHPFWDFNRPVPPGVIYIGGYRLHPDKELPQNLKTYIESSEDGVIYVSFGSSVMTSLINVQKIQIMISVLSKLPYKILWKWNSNEFPAKSDNIRTSDWFPQWDILRHPKVRLFITQGGLHSSYEAILAGVPLIGIPILGDQWVNTEKYELFQIGKQLDMPSLTEEVFTEAVQTVLKDESYRTNVLHLRSLMYDQPQSALDRAVWWIEYVLRHKGALHLRAPAANMSWSEYYDIEFLLTWLTILFGVLIIFIYFLERTLKNIFNSGVKIKIA